MFMTVKSSRQITSLVLDIALGYIKLMTNI